MPTLSSLSTALATSSREGPGGDPEIRGLALDSRQVQRGDLFFCIPGLKADGRRFLPQAVRQGAVAAVVEGPVPDAEVPLLRVPAVREAMARLAAAFYGNPSRHFQLVGVTGTNGKTTTTCLVEAIARQAGCGTGIIGTLGARIHGEELPGDRTTPESPELQSLLHQMAQADRGTGMVVAIEVSSHALAQDRTLGAEFDVGVFTNLTQDHLDYHGSMEEYFRAKRRLFTQYPEESTKPFHAIVNRDDPYGRRLEQEAAGIVWSYGVESEALLQAWNIQATASGLAYTLRTPDGEAPIRLALGGLFNVANSLAAAGAARALGLSWETIRLGLEAAPAAPGRFESVNEGQEFGVLVDYAHTPDGLLNVLESARALQPRRLLVVFGCGGDRDRTKRPIMAGIAARLADHAIITSDNPRTEDPTAIVQEIAAGLTPEAPHDVIVDRRAAIRHAIQSAGPGDLVVIAGKGHETYQIFADGTIHFDDREEARAALRARRSG